MHALSMINLPSVDYIGNVPLFAIGRSGVTNLPFSLSLTAVAANALNSFFNVTAFTAGLGIGVAGTAPSTVPGFFEGF